MGTVDTGFAPGFPTVNKVGCIDVGCSVGTVGSVGAVGTVGASIGEVGTVCENSTCAL